MADYTRTANGLGTTRGAVPVVLSAFSTVAAAGNGTVIAAVAGKRIVVLSLSLSGTPTTAGLVELKDGAGGTTKWGAAPGVNGTGAMVEAGLTGGYLFALTAGNLLQMVNGGTGGSAYLNVRYILEDV